MSIRASDVRRSPAQPPAYHDLTPNTSRGSIALHSNDSGSTRNISPQFSNLNTSSPGNSGTPPIGYCGSLDRKLIKARQRMRMQPSPSGKPCSPNVSLASVGGPLIMPPANIFTNSSSPIRAGWLTKFC